MMTDVIAQWASDHQVPDIAVQDLRQRLMFSSLPFTATGQVEGISEAAVSQQIRFSATKYGTLLWRNNVGAAVHPESGRHVRYGLANDSKKLNEHIKSSDLIGIRKLIVTPEMVGSTLGQFVAIETKEGDWTWRGTEREQAQQRFLELVNTHGGFGVFANGPIDLSVISP